MSPDGDVLPHPTVPAWAEGVRRFLWDEETNAFIDIGPRTVPAYEWVSASAGSSGSGSSGGRGASITSGRLVWVEEEDVAEVRQEMLEGVRKTLADLVEQELG